MLPSSGASPASPDGGAGPRWRRGLAARLALIVAVAAVLGSIRGGAALPLDGHEVLVAQSAQEMIERGDYLIPRFGGEVRLKKPPLSYWLAVAADRVLGADGRVTALEARLPSILAGVGLALTTAALGAVLLGASTGVLAGLFVATSGGLVAYTHSARPEMLYALLCQLALLGWVFAWKHHAGPGRRREAALAAAAGWVAAGLAVLAKGPQLPLLMFAGLVVGLWRAGQIRAVRPALRPILGFVILLAVCLWWFVVAERRAGALVIWGEEAAIRGRAGTREWWRFFDPYYLYRPVGLLLPWALLLPMAFLAPWWGRLRGRASVGVLWTLLVVCLAALNLVWGRRWYYALPVLGVVAVLGAAVVREVVRECGRTMRGRRGLAVGLALHAVGIAAAAWWMGYGRSAPPPPIWVPWALTVAAGVAAGVLLAARRRLGPGAVMAVVGLGTFFLGGMELRGSLWDDRRDQSVSFAEAVAAHVPPGRPLLGWGDFWHVEKYYARRPISVIRDRAALASLVGEGEAWLLVKRDAKARAVPPGLRAEVRVTGDREGEEGDEWVELLRLTPDPSRPARDATQPDRGATQPATP